MVYPTFITSIFRQILLSTLVNKPPSRVASISHRRWRTFAEAWLMFWNLTRWPLSEKTWPLGNPLWKSQENIVHDEITEHYGTKWRLIMFIAGKIIEEHRKLSSKPCLMTPEGNFFWICQTYSSKVPKHSKWELCWEIDHFAWNWKTFSFDAQSINRLNEV